MLKKFSLILEKNFIKLANENFEYLINFYHSRTFMPNFEPFFQPVLHY